MSVHFRFTALSTDLRQFSRTHNSPAREIKLADQILLRAGVEQHQPVTGDPGRSEDRVNILHDLNIVGPIGVSDS